MELVQNNRVNGHDYPAYLVAAGLWVCPQCQGAFSGPECDSCGFRRPVPVDIAQQWGEVRALDDDGKEV